MLNVKVSNVYASAIATVGSIKLLEFLLVCAAAGITFKAIDEAEKIMEEFDTSEFKFLDEKPDRPPQEPDPRTKKVILTLLGLNVGIKVRELVDDVKGFFNSIGVKSDNNKYMPGTTIDFHEHEYYHPDMMNVDNVINASDMDRYFFKSDNVEVGQQFYFKAGTIGLIAIFEENKNNPEYDQKYRIRYNFTGGDNPKSGVVYTNKRYMSVDLNHSYQVHRDKNMIYYASYGLWLNYSGGTSTRNVYNVMQYIENNEFLYQEYKEPQPFKYVDYYVDPNSYVLGNKIKPENKYPNVSKLISKLDNIEKVVNPNGQIQHIYHGTTDDLINDIAENTTIDDFYTDDKQQIEPITEEKIIIDTDINTDDLPYPEIEEEPQETPTGLGKIIALIKQSINWLSRIFRIIGDFFTIPEDVNIDFEPLKNTGLKQVFPFCIPFDFYESIKLFAREAKEPEFKICMDTEFFTVDHTVDIGFMRFFVGFLRYIVVIYFSWILMNKTRNMMKW